MIGFILQRYPDALALYVRSRSPSGLAYSYLWPFNSPQPSKKGYTMRKLICLPVIMLCLPAAMCTSEQPGIEVRTVPVPVPQPCLPADEIPAEPETVGDQLTGSSSSDLVIVAASSLRLRIWGQTMHSALVACAE